MQSTSNTKHTFGVTLALLTAAGFINASVAQAQDLTLGQSGGTILSGTSTLTDSGTTASGTYTYDDGGTGTALNLQNRYNSWNTYGYSTANVSGGYINDLLAYDSSITNFNGGSINYIETYGNSTVDANGGDVDQTKLVGPSGIFAYENSTANVSKGFFYYLWTYDASTANVSGGNINFFNTLGTGTANISGGNIELLFSSGTSTANISGGRFTYLEAEKNTTLNLFGTGFTETLLNTYPLYQAYSVTGTLQNGDALDAYYYDYGGNLTFNAPVPEASSVVSMGLLLLLGLGGVAVSRKRKGQAAV